MGSWHLVLVIAWAIVIWYAMSALLRPIQTQDSEFLPYIGELLALVAIFFIVYGFQEIIEHIYAWKDQK